MQSKGSSGDFVIRDSTGAADRITLDSSGNVGIGTNSPDRSLHIAGSEPTVVFENTGQGTDLKTWRIYSNSSSLQVGTVDDAFSAGQNALEITRDNTDNITGIQFKTGASSERMRIDSSGNVLVGTTSFDSATVGFGVGNNGLMFATRSGANAAIFNRQTSDGQLIDFQRQNSNVGSISVTSSGTTYNTTSDIRLKTDIAPIADATDKLMAMNAVTHKWKADPDADAVVGFIAQEMQEIVPEAVSKGDSEDDMWSMDYGRITPVLVAALQDAHKKIEDLETRLAALEAN
jgi:hypothetical protein